MGSFLFVGRVIDGETGQIVRDGKAQL